MRLLFLAFILVLTSHFSRANVDKDVSNSTNANSNKGSSNEIYTYFGGNSQTNNTTKPEGPSQQQQQEQGPVSPFANIPTAAKAIGFSIWYCCLILCCIVPTCCAYRRRRLIERQLAEQQAEWERLSALRHQSMFAAAPWNIEEWQNWRKEQLEEQLAGTTMVCLIPFRSLVGNRGSLTEGSFAFILTDCPRV